MKRFNVVLLFCFVSIFFINTSCAAPVSNKAQQKIAQKQKLLAKKNQMKQKLGKLQRLNRWNAKASNVFKAEGLVKKLSAKKLIKIVKGKKLSKMLKINDKFVKILAKKSLTQKLYLDLGSIKASELAEEYENNNPDEESMNLENEKVQK